MIRRVLVLGDPAKPAVRQAVAKALPALRRHLGRVSVQLDGGRRHRADEADLAVVFGGDGAILRAARYLAPADIPMIGVNLGKLGFLTEVDQREVPAMARRLAEGRATQVSALMLACALVRKGRVVSRGLALNDVVLGGGGISRLKSFELRVDGQPVATYPADGLIVATPSGSTAHSLSAGGTVLAPGEDGFAITPISPHTLSHRPLVVGAGSRLDIRLSQCERPITLTLDGQQVHSMREGDAVAITRSEHPCRFLLLRRRAYFSTLRQKLHWDRNPRR